MTTAKTITNAWLHRTLPDIFYEEPGPIEEGMRQEHSIDLIKRCLSDHYEGRPDVFVSNAVFLSYDQTNGNARVRPDLFITFGVDAETIRHNLPNYWLWEIGQPPDFVMEVASPSTAANDLGRKRQLYQRLNITEYWRFDPTGGNLYGQPIAGDQLQNRQYHPIPITTHPDGSHQAHSPLLNLDFHWNGTAFDVLDPATGKSLNRLADEIQARQAAEAQLTQVRAERNAAEAEAARLRQLLRRYKQQ